MMSTLARSPSDGTAGAQVGFHSINSWNTWKYQVLKATQKAIYGVLLFGEANKIDLL